MPEYYSLTLKNGIRIIHKQIPENISYCGFFINAGTRDELPAEFGMAHFVEHMLFKGTAKRKAYHIINRMEAVGGELNAYTNKEETVVYSIFLEEQVERAVELLGDLVFNSQFPQKEIEKEVDVILDEISSYEDSPSELIYDEFENIVFKNSQLGHNILGDADTLNNFESEKAKSFVKRNYTADNIVFFSLGRTDFKKLVRIVNKHLEDVEIPFSDRQRIVPSDVLPVHIHSDKNTFQSHVLLGARSYNLYDKKRKTLSLINNILGGPGMNSRLNISLREKRGLVYNVESNITGYSDTGLFSVYFGSDKQNTEKCIRLIYSELKKLRETKLTSSQLSAAKKQFIGQIGVSADNHENLALALGKSLFHYNHFNSAEETFKKIDAITEQDILDVANEVFDERNLFSLTFR
ncbi:MAG: M16 family metallopeptidase [Dysgonomonas sp.]